MRIAKYLAPALLLTTPVFAADALEAPSSPWSGYGDLYFGKLWTSGGSGDINAVGGAARINYSFNERWNAQGDFTVDHIYKGSNSLTTLRGAAHVYWRDPQAYALGGFLHYDRSLSGGNLTPVYNITGGLEGQVYSGDWTLYGQAWYGQFRSTSGPGQFDTYGARAEARYYFTDNVRLDGGLAFTHLGSGGSGANIVSPYLQANYRFDQHPVTLFARYQGDFVSGEGNYQKAVIGLRFSFGSGSIKDEERRGPAMDTFRMGFPFGGRG